MRVRLAVEMDVEGCEASDTELAIRYGPEKIRSCVRQAVDNALGNIQSSGYAHDLDNDLALFCAAVHILPE